MNNSIVQAYRVDCVILKEENIDDCSSRHDLHVVERSRGQSSKPHVFQTLNNGGKHRECRSVFVVPFVTIFRVIE